MTDPIADMIIRIKNALLARHSQVIIPNSKIKHSIAQILEREGYITGMELTEEKPQGNLVITLKYTGKTPVITDVKRLSTPGRRVYAPADQIPKALGGYGITIISTSKGVITDKQARQQNVGGELLCQIW
jgi:small subunit ribosomal protein S8